MKIARLFAVAALLALLGACAHPPQAEIDAARAALDAASRNADVITYAPDSLRRAQEKMAGQQAGDKQHQGGVDAAAFRSDLDGDSGQLKHESVLQKRGARYREKSPDDHG